MLSNLSNNLSNIVSIATLVAVAYYLRRSGVGWTPALLVACCAASSLGLCVASVMGIRTLKNEAGNFYVTQGGRIVAKPKNAASKVV